MERTKISTKLPDAINHSIGKNFTQIPNDMLRNPNISAKAKAVLCLLLSNKDSWTSYLTTIKTMMKEGKDSIQHAIIELEQYGYMKRIRYCNKTTKRFVGSFLAYTDTPHMFSLRENLEILSDHGMEPWAEPQPGKPVLANPVLANPVLGNQPLIILNNNNTNFKKIDLFLQTYDYLFPDKYWKRIIRNWFIYKKDLRQSYANEKTMALHVKEILKMSNNDYKTAKQIYNQSMVNNWAGIFPLKNGYTSKQNIQYGYHEKGYDPGF